MNRILALVLFLGGCTQVYNESVTVQIEGDAGINTVYVNVYVDAGIPIYQTKPTDVMFVVDCNEVDYSQILYQMQDAVENIQAMFPNDRFGYIVAPDDNSYFSECPIYIAEPFNQDGGFEASFSQLTGMGDCYFDGTLNGLELSIDAGWNPRSRKLVVIVSEDAPGAAAPPSAACDAEGECGSYPKSTQDVANDLFDAGIQSIVFTETQYTDTLEWLAITGDAGFFQGDQDPQVLMTILNQTLVDQ